MCGGVQSAGVVRTGVVSIQFKALVDPPQGPRRGSMRTSHANTVKYHWYDRRLLAVTSGWVHALFRRLFSSNALREAYPRPAAHGSPRRFATWQTLQPK